jgi:hypothetical protein
MQSGQQRNTFGTPVRRSIQISGGLAAGIGGDGARSYAKHSAFKTLLVEENKSVFAPASSEEHDALLAA